jgi:broad specificity phosphatase PhoE
MPRIVFMRHSEPDYTFVKERKYIGHGIDLAQLTENGIQIAENASGDNRLNNAEIIVSSPYTRALQTAAIISKNRQLEIKIELDLHEWMPDLSFQYRSKEEASKANRLCIENKGVCPADSVIKFENLDDVFIRAKNALLRYSKYSKIIVVTHGVVIRRFYFSADIPFCGISEIDFDESFTCTEFKTY